MSIILFDIIILQYKVYFFFSYPILIEDSPKSYKKPLTKIYTKTVAGTLNVFVDIQLKIYFGCGVFVVIFAVRIF